MGNILLRTKLYHTRALSVLWQDDDYWDEAERLKKQLNKRKLEHKLKKMAGF